MRDEHLRADDGRADDPLDAWIARHLPSASSDDDAVPAPDASRVAAHFAGVGDESLLIDAARHPSIRRLLADVASAASDADEDVRSGAAPAPSPTVRDAALAAFAEEAADADAAREPLPEPLVEPTAAPRRASGWRARPSRSWLRAAAALVVVGLPATVFLSTRASAGPALSLVGIERSDAAGTVTVEGPRSMGVGSRIAASADERVALRLGEGSRVVLTPGSEVRVVRDDAAPAPARRGGPRAALALDRGAAVLASPGEAGSDDADVPRLLLPDGRWLALERGAAHVAVGAAGGTVVSLPRDGAVRCCPAAAGADCGLTRGPGAFVLDASGLVAAPQGSAEGRAAEAALRDLAFYGGEPLPSRTASGRATSARYWRVLRLPRGAEPVAPTRASDADGLPAVRFDLAPAAAAVPALAGRVAWRPDGEALASTRLTVVLAARPARAGPDGAPVPDAPRPRVTVAAETFDGRVLATSEAVPGGSEPLRLDLALPEALRESVGDGEIVLAFRVGDAPALVWFEAAVFRAGDVRSPAAKE